MAPPFISGETSDNTQSTGLFKARDYKTLTSSRGRAVHWSRPAPSAEGPTNTPCCVCFCVCVCVEFTPNMRLSPATAEPVQLQSLVLVEKLCCLRRIIMAIEAPPSFPRSSRGAFQKVFCFSPQKASRDAARSPVSSASLPLLPLSLHPDRLSCPPHAE